MTKKKKSLKNLKKSKTISVLERNLYGSKKTNPKLFFREIKTFWDYNEIKKAANYVANPNNFFHQYVYGIPFTNDYQKARSKYLFAYTEDLERDLYWTSISIHKYANEINDFVSRSEKFQKEFLKGEYDKAENTLNEISQLYGISLWLIEKKFLLSEYAKGLEENKIYLSKILGGEDDDNALLDFIVYYMSMRCESKLSYENYKISLYRGLEFPDEYSQLKAYLLYRLEHLSHQIHLPASEISYFEGPCTIIDRYLTFISILQTSAVNDSDQKNVIENIVKKLVKKIDDIRLKGLFLFLNPKNYIEINQTEKKIIDILDCYTEGDYEKSFKDAANIIKEFPDIYEMYHIYIRSLLHLEKPFKDIFKKDSFASKILEHSYIVTKAEKDWKNSCESLFKISLTLWRDPVAYRLYEFYLRETLPSPNHKFYQLSLLNASPLNPKFSTIYENQNDAQDYFIHSLKEYSNKSTLVLAKGMTCRSCDPQPLNLPAEIPEGRRVIYTAENLMANGYFSKAISIIKPFWNDISNEMSFGNLLFRDRVIKILFRCYLETKEIAACIEMVVKSYLINKVITKKLPLINLIDEIEKVSLNEVYEKISYPIIYSIYYSKARNIYVAYDNFLSSLGLTRPTQMIDIENKYHAKELHLFFSEVCKLEVLACSYHFNGTKDIENERIRLCQYLSEKDEANNKKYSEEISKITSSSLIKEGIRQIDHSKIYVDEAGIRNTGRKLFKERFERYQEMASMSSIETLNLFDPDNIHLLLPNEKGDMIKMHVTKDELESRYQTTRIVPKSLFIIFKEIFMDVRDRFISSGEYGLDGYLSVRIRHGVLQNQIRSIFEALYLVSEKDTSTKEYQNNLYWEKRLKDLDKREIDIVQGSLKQFSKFIDETAAHLNKKIIQVKTEKKNDKGLFDYTFSSTELYELFVYEFVNIVDFDHFLDSVLRVLWAKTQENLSNIRSYISDEIKETISKKISDLERELRLQIEPSKIPELLQNIARSQTDLQYSLDGIAQWFTISKSSVIPKFTFDDLISICIKSINNIYPHRKIYPNVCIGITDLVDGIYFIPFFDIVRTIIDNIIVHSGLSTENMDIDIGIKSEYGFLIIEIKNKLSSIVYKEDPVEKLNKKHSVLKEGEISEIIAKEGSTGLIKVRKILTIDLKRRLPSLDFAYDDNKKFAVTIKMESEGLH